MFLWGYEDQIRVKASLKINVKLIQSSKQAEHETATHPIRLNQGMH